VFIANSRVITVFADYRNVEKLRQTPDVFPLVRQQEGGQTFTILALEENQPWFFVVGSGYHADIYAER
jgi:hypothetical protein